MPFTYNATLLLGSSQTGLSLKAGLIDTAGVIHATHRDITAGFVEIGGGMYSWVYSSVPDGYRGSAVYYTGTLGAASSFSGVTLKTATPVAPEEFENADVKTGSRAAAGDAMTLAAGAITEATITVPTVSGVASGVLGMLVQLWRRAFKKSTLDVATGELKTYADDGTTVLTTQAATDDGTTQTLGGAS
jgi:hypothetical protein